MQCVTECPATKVGRKGAALQKFFYEGDDSIWTRLTAKNNYVAGDPNDYRFTIRFDKDGFRFFIVVLRFSIHHVLHAALMFVHLHTRTISRFICFLFS